MRSLARHDNQGSLGEFVRRCVACAVGSAARVWVLVVAVGVAVPIPRTAEAQRAAASATPGNPPLPGDTAFAARVARLSEPAGFFDTDNLISNESSFLHVVPRLRELGVRGGAYLGVGPDQNYSYIAAIRPTVAYLVDVRRDNLLQHLMFKSLFARSSSRLEFLCRWLGRRLPGDLGRYADLPVAELTRYLAEAPVDELLARRARNDIVADAAATGVALTDDDRATLRRFHDAFTSAGLELRFTSFGRGPRPGYPSLRELVEGRDAAGRPSSYLAREEDWRFVQGLHRRNRIIPVVGNLAGPHALRAIARELAASRDSVSAFYTSNVEYYLWGDGTFDAFARNVAALPRADRSVIIRSYFGRQFGDQHPLATPGSNSVQLLHSLGDFTRRWRGGGWTSYRALVTDDAR